METDNEAGRRSDEDLELRQDSRPRALRSRSFQSVRASRVARWAARVFGVLLVLVPIFLVLAPWRQNITGQGQVSALSPLDRLQPIEAPINGRIQEWFVREGSKVEAGDPLFRIEDQDSERLERLILQVENIRKKFEEKNNQIGNLQSVVDELTLTRDSLIQSIEAEIEVALQKVESAREKLKATQSKRDYAIQNFDARQRLLESEAEASLNVRKAEAELAVAEADVGVAAADVDGALASVREIRAKLEATRAKENAAIEKAKGDISEKISEREEVEKELRDQESKVARQRSQAATAPRGGTVFRLEGGQGGEIVKEGDRVLTLVPDAVDTAVELWVDGNDAPLVHVGDPVRLQFEGWPAVQFVGWPSAAVGTFGGRVTLVDPTDDGLGKFRVLVQPDLNDLEWPDPTYLRQGVRTKGWILLNEVSLGWELWRQLNGFPPVIAQEEPTGTARKRIK